MGSYSFFNQGVDIFAANAFEVPDDAAGVQPARPADDLPRPTNGKGGIRNVVNDIGGSSTIANPDVPVTVVTTRDATAWDARFTCPLGSRVNLSESPQQVAYVRDASSGASSSGIFIECRQRHALRCVRRLIRPK